MKKRIIAVTLVMALALGSAIGLSGCGKKDPIETFNAAQENIKNAKDVSLKGKITGKVSLSNTKLDVPMNMEVQYIAPKDKKDLSGLEMAMKFDVSAFGQSMKGEFFIKDKMVYSSMDGEKTKTTLSKEDFASALDAANNSKAPDIKEYVIESKQDGDDIELVINAKDYLIASLKSIDGKDKPSEKEIKEIEKTLNTYGVSKATIKATIKNDNFTAVKLTTSFKFDQSALIGSGSSTDKPEMAIAKITMDFNDIKIDSGLKIKYPDLKNFTNTTTNDNLNLL